MGRDAPKLPCLQGCLVLEVPHPTGFISSSLCPPGAMVGDLPRVVNDNSGVWPSITHVLLSSHINKSLWMAMIAMRYFSFFFLFFKTIFTCGSRGILKETHFMVP